MARHSACLRLTLLFVVAWVCVSPPARVAAEAPPAAGGETREMVRLTNAERSRAGRAPLAASPRLMKAAQLHAEQMVARGQMAHDLPGARYPQTEDRLAAAQYRWLSYAENVAYGQPDPVSALDSWMDSPGHRRNILNASMTELGTGFARDRSGRPYYVQVFGRPRSR
ncbi:MAG TPA: CAP domain-containing protein [Vicinamibacterales bacterium]|nr:CAP domain-containing protein [Vicinamibacterales bacterium]